MELGELASLQVVEAALLIGGLLAVASAIVGHKKERISDDILVIIGFIAGAVIILIGVMVLIDNHDIPDSSIIMLFVLGGGLFLHLAKKIKFAAIIALVVGIVVGYLINEAAISFGVTDVLTPLVIVIITLVIMVIIYVFLKFFEEILHLAGGILSFRPIMFVVGVLALVEAALLYTGSSLSALL